MRGVVEGVADRVDGGVEAVGVLVDPEERDDPDDECSRRVRLPPIFGSDLISFIGGDLLSDLKNFVILLCLVFEEEELLLESWDRLRFLFLFLFFGGIGGVFLTNSVVIIIIS